MKPALLCLLALAAPSSAQLFVDSHRGADTNPGSAAAPVRSIGRALALATAGTHVWIRGGVYGAASGESLPIVIGGTGANHANVTIEGIGVVSLELQQHIGAGIRVEGNAANLRLVNLRFRGGNPASLRSAAIEAGSAAAPATANDVVIERCTFEDVRRGLLLWRTHDGTRASRWLVHHCLFDRVSSEAIDEPDTRAGNVFVHNTIAGSAIGLWANGNQSMVESNVVVGNAVGVFTNNTTAPSRFANNDVWGNGIDWAGIAAPPNNLSVDPQFADASRRLGATSPLIDAATTTMLTQRLDHDGNPGVVAQRSLQADLGCHEWNDTSLFAALQYGSFALRLDGPAGLPAAALFSLGEGLIQLPGQSPIALNPNTLLNLAVTGTLPFQLVAPVSVVPPGVQLMSQGLAIPGAGPLKVSNAVAVWGDGGSAAVIEELFADGAQRDSGFSSGTWGNGSAQPGQIGGDGELGDFEPGDGVQVAPNVFEWTTHNQTIPGTRTLGGQPITVTDGTFRFARFVVPAGVTVRFVGARPARILVRGTMNVQGVVENSGAVMPENLGGATGQPGGLGGAGGGNGGNGADSGNGLGNQPRFDGGDGEDVKLAQGHAWSGRAAGTGGRGSVQFPLSGTNAAITFGYFNFYSVQLSAGGAGGGNSTAGGQGRAVSTHMNRTQDLGPAAPGGVRFDPFPYQGPLATFDHFLIGGAGGGGSGSHPFFSLEIPRTPNWRSGSGGAGGGGTFGARVGGDLVMPSLARIEVRGGSGFPSGNVVAFPGAGGGGAGGAIVLQVGGMPSLGGVLDARGGSGGYNRAPVFTMDQSGGAGGDGVLRLEVARVAPDPRLLGVTFPPVGTENVAALADSDTVVGDQSHWYPSNLTAPPVWLRYELDVEVGAARLRYSDDPTRGLLAGPGQPVQLYVQGAQVDPITRQPNPGTIGGWRVQVGKFNTALPALNDDRATGARFLILFDRSIAQAAVKRVAFYLR